MNILVTAIGSFSATCVIEKLKQSGHHVLGCDIYPKEYHYESFLCEKFYQVPKAVEELSFLNSILDICKKEEIEIIIPLTDVEIDTLNKNREIFKINNINLAIQSSYTLEFARNKFNLFKFIEKNPIIPVVRSLSGPLENLPFPYPFIAKPKNGRSSEGLIIIESDFQFELVKHRKDYLFQEFIEGEIITVDYIRNKNSEQDFLIPRKELLRTKNGAGITVRIIQNEKLESLVRYIGKQLDINGCVCFEFIENGDSYYLIDVNPRFSAGIAFSCIAGYDFINSHLNCFLDKNILSPIEYYEQTLVKIYNEEITSISF